MIYVFNYKGWGQERSVEVEASCYPLACYELGKIHHEEFARLGVPDDFEMRIPNVPEILQPAAAEPSEEIQCPS